MKTDMALGRRVVRRDYPEITENDFRKRMLGRQVIIAGYVGPFTVTLVRSIGTHPLTLRRVEGSNIRTTSCAWEDVQAILPTGGVGAGKPLRVLSGACGSGKGAGTSAHPVSTQTMKPLRGACGFESRPPGP